VRPTPPTVISFPSSCSHLRRITDIESVATTVLPLGTLTGTTGAIIWRAVFHVACMRPASVHSFLEGTPRCLDNYMRAVCSRHESLYPYSPARRAMSALQWIGRPRIIALARHPSI